MLVPDLDPYSDTLIVFLKAKFEKKIAEDKKHEKLPSMQS